MTSKTRLTLLERIRSTRSGQPWEDFVATYDGVIDGWLRSEGIVGHDAEDLRQEVLGTVVREIGSFDHNGRAGAFRTWLRRITANRMRRVWQSRKARPADYAGPDLASIASQLEDESSRLTLRWDAEHDRYVVERLVRMLAGRFSQRSLLVFRRIVLGGEPAERVAAELGMTLGAARVAQHRVLRALREMGRGLVGENDPPEPHASGPV